MSIRLQVLVFFLVTTFVVFAKNSAKFYLVDNFDKYVVSKYDKEIIDSVLTSYHHSTNVISQLESLNYLADNLNCSVWESYNAILNKKCEKVLSKKENYADNYLFGKVYANSINNLGVISQAEDDYIAAIDYYLKAFDLRKAINDSKGTCETLVNLSHCYLAIREFGPSEKFMKQALAIAKKNKDVESELMAYIQLVYLFQRKGDPKQALVYTEKGLHLARMKDNDMLLSELCFIKADYLVDQSSSESISLYREGLSYAKDKFRYKHLSYGNMGIGTCFYEINQYDSAIFYHEIASKWMSDWGYRSENIYLYSNLAKDYAGLKNYQKALYFAEKGFEIAVQKKYETESIFLANEIKRYAEELNQWADAFRITKFISKKNAMQSIENNKKKSRIENTIFNAREQLLKKNYEKSLAIIRLSKEVELNDVQSKSESIRNTMYIWLSVILTILVLFFIYNKQQLRG